MKAYVKRVFDIVLSIPMLIVFSPIIATLVVCICLGSAGPGIFRQARVGRHRKTFTCYKLRTMTQNTPSAPTHELTAASTTRIGGFLRRTKLDELPQLWNIVKGDMSFVGPRPCLPSQTALIEERNKLELYKIRPGITGVSQLAGMDMSDPEKLAQLDATYLDKMGVVFDLKTILKTAIGGGRGDRVRKI